MNFTKIGNKIICLDIIDSTNNYIANLLRVGKIDFGTVVLAERQEKGRGQMGTVWQSESGKNLTSSVLLGFENFPIEHQFKISMLVALAINKYINQLNIPSKIKWPNDIIVNQKKIAGVLIENQLEKSNIKSCIVGIGMNVNQSIFDNLNATSLRNESEKENDINWVCLQLHQTISSVFEEKINWSHEQIAAEYCDCLHGFNEFVPVINLKTDTPENIKITQILPSGLIETKNLKGIIEVFDLKQIKFILQNEF